MEGLWILAQAESNAPEVVKAEDISSQGQQTTQTLTKQTDPNSKVAVQNGPKPNPYASYMLLALIFIMLYFVMFRGPKKKQQQDQMVKALKKNDRVQTIGGILGTVLEVTDSEITLKVDESNNTKIKVVPSAINRVIEQK
ncbi:MAG: preprotein translocase subunit YajC [Phycisphaerae bacterium]|nr:preprotein translocase subunit YajC [Phycisphaerae bacterium]